LGSAQDGFEQKIEKHFTCLAGAFFVPKKRPRFPSKKQQFVVCHRTRSLLRSATIIRDVVCQTFCQFPKFWNSIAV
jgi:hypothetical protein